MANQTATVGTLAPEFTLPCTRVPGSARDRAALADYRGRWLILLFYPRDFSLICPTELSAVGSRLEEFTHRGCDVLGISTDPVASHERWVATPRSQGGLGGLGFPLASDVSGEVARAYGVYLGRQHLALRGLFVIDPNGVLQYQVVHNLSVGRRTDELLRVLDALQTGGLCAESWSPGDATLDPTEQLGPGSILGDYRIDSVLGSGSFATVYRATDRTLERPVALKILKPGGVSAPARLLAEARLAAALNHPNVCTVFAADASEGVSFIAMEYVAGRPLSRVLEAGPLPEAQAVSVARQIAEGMAAAHARGIVHGDLKPANIMLTEAGLAKVMDFGLSRRDPGLPDPAATVLWQAGDAQGISGTPSYMSPEQARGEPITPASDVFAFGLVLYELLTGHKAFAGTSLLEVFRQIESVDPARYAAQVPESFRDLLSQALVPDARERRVSMAEIAACLGERFRAEGTETQAHAADGAVDHRPEVEI
jgi:eukaryotic-like serine/threonine-protein kinase